jgi:uncharacterized protein (TIGR03435 family)
MLAMLLLGSLAAAQSKTAAKLEFDVGSVRLSKSGVSRSNVPLGPGNVFTPTGGLFSASNFPLATYIAFAYRIMGSQQESLLSQLPAWAATDGFDIQARAEGNPTKDEMRLMMRALLADRFKLAMHTETRQVQVFVLTLPKTGKPTPRFQPHPEGSSCSTVPGQRDDDVEGEFPAICGGLLGMNPNAPGLSHAGARNVSIGFIANLIAAMGRLDRQVIDRTGLSGNFDFALEWAPEPDDPRAPRPDDLGPPFVQAVKEQLGLKLESQKGPADVLVLDYVEHPSKN